MTQQRFEQLVAEPMLPPVVEHPRQGSCMGGLQATEIHRSEKADRPVQWVIARKLIQVLLQKPLVMTAPCAQILRQGSKFGYGDIRLFR